MKKTGKLSFLVAMMIAITNIAFVAMPSVGAQETGVIVSDDFETGYTPISTNAESTYKSMKELCDMDPWWYSAKSTVFNKAGDVNENTPLIASVVGDGNNNALRLMYHSEAGIGTNITTPGRTNYFEYESGTYEVNFKLYTTGNVQVMGIGGKMVDGTATYYKHNILTKKGSVTYMGDAEASSPAGVAGVGINSNAWYTFKVVVNNDFGYYSVEVMDKNGASIQRVGGINIKDGCPAISNIRFQAIAEGSVVYIDDYSVKKVAPQTLLYEDDFDIYSGFSGAPGTYTAGTNLFKEISPFRVQDVNSQFVLGADETNASDKYFQLRASKAETGYYPANAMYMPWNGHILTKDSQKIRGKLQLTFSFCVDASAAPSGANASFRVICDDNFSGSDIADLENNNYTMFRVQPFQVSGGVGYGIQKADNGDSSASYQQIKKGTWYDVQLTFDMINDKVTMAAVQSGTTAQIKYERSTGLYNGGTPLESIKSIMFKADKGMVIDIDDVKIKYVSVVPQVAGTEIIDFNGEKVLNTATVNPAISAIKIPFTYPVTDESVKDITIKVENEEEAFAGYTTTHVNGVYTLNFDNTLLAPNTKYIITVPKTVTSVEGIEMAEEYTYEFTTGEGKAEIEMIGINLNSLADVKNGAEFRVTTKFANSKNVPADCLFIVGYYDEGNTMLGSTYIRNSIPANSKNMNAAFRPTVPAAEKLDVSKVNRISIYLWDNVENMIPYCETIDIQGAMTDGE